MADAAHRPRVRLGETAVRVASLLTVLCAASAIAPLVTGLAWTLVPVLAAAFAVTVVAIASRLGMPPIPAGIAALAALPLFAVADAGGGKGLLWVLPSDAAARAVDAALAAGGNQIATDAVPTIPSTGLVLIIALGVAAAAVVADVVAVGYRLPLGVVPVAGAIVIAPGRILPVGIAWPALVATGIALLLLLAADRRRAGHRPHPAALAALVAGSLVVAALGTTVLPVPSAAVSSGNGGLIGPGADPLLKLGSDLRQGAATDLLRITTTSTAPAYLRLAVLEQFSGQTWQPNDAGFTQLTDGATAPHASGTDTAGSRGVSTTVDVINAAAVGRWLPLPYPTTTVRGLSQVAGFFWENRGLTVERGATSTPVTGYTAYSLELKQTADQLKAVTGTPAPAFDDASLSLPAKVPSVITRTARSWTKGATGPYAEALAIQNHLAGGDFTYDVNAPVTQHFDGDGLAVIAKFLSVKAGYCVHFASTMAVMARILGIPSRVVVGYQPGTSTSVAGRVEQVVSSNDLHAWPELYFGGVGWVRFEPTPGRGVTPSYAPLPVSAGGLVTGQTSGATPGASAAPSARSNVETPQTAAEAAKQQHAAAGAGLTAAAVLLGVLLIGAVPFVIRRLRRRRRLAAVRTSGSAASGWNEVIDTATDLGLHPPGRASPRAVEAALAAEVGADPALTRLRTAYEASAYGAETWRMQSGDVAAVLTRMRGAAPAGRRVAAAVAPRSLLGTIGGSRLAFRWSPPGSDETTRAARLGRTTAPRRPSPRNRSRQ